MACCDDRRGGVPFWTGDGKGVVGSGVGQGGLGLTLPSAPDPRAVATLVPPGLVRSPHPDPQKEVTASVFTQWPCFRRWFSSCFPCGCHPRNPSLLCPLSWLPPCRPCLRHGGRGRVDLQVGGGRAVSSSAPTHPFFATVT